MTNDLCFCQWMPELVTLLAPTNSAPHQLWTSPRETPSICLFARSVYPQHQNGLSVCKLMSCYIVSNVFIMISFLCFFSPQVYRLMSRRLKELCTTLNISDELRLKVWTCFEHSLVHCTHLMVDRHLDQMLMCAIYITAKVGLDLSLEGLTFLKINNWFGKHACVWGYFDDENCF